MNKVNYIGGPRTDSGKERSSQNAVKHGIFSHKIVLLPGETQEQFDELHDGFKQSYKPYGTHEECLVHRLAMLEWRLHRMDDYESVAMRQALEAGNTDAKFVNTCGIYTQRLTREFQSVLKTLHAEQAARLLAHGQDYRQAVLIRDHYKRQEIDWDPASDQFVFSRELLDKQIAFNRQWDRLTKNVHIYSTTKYQDEHFAHEALVCRS